MKERITDLGVLGRDYQAILHAIGRINLLTEKPGRGDWPERFKLEKLEGQEFLDKAVSVGKVARRLKEETLPRLKSKEEQIRQKVERLEEQVAEIRELALSGFIGQADLTKAQEILQEVKELKPTLKPNSNIAENTLGRNAERRKKKADLALAIEAAVLKVDKKPFYTINDVAAATEREPDDKLRKLIYIRMRKDRKSKNPKWDFKRYHELRFRKDVFRDLVKEVLTARKIMRVHHRKPIEKETFITPDQHQMLQFKSEIRSNIIKLLLARRQRDEKVYTEEIIDLGSGSESSQTLSKQAAGRISHIRNKIKPFGWVIDTYSEYDTESRKRKTSYSLRRHDEKQHGDNTAPLASIKSAQPVLHEQPTSEAGGVLLPADEVFKAAVVQPIEAPAADNQSEKWWKDHMPDQPTYTVEDFWKVLKEQKGKENLTLVYVSMTVTHIKLKLGILGQRLSKSRTLYYQKEDARKIMKALLATKPRERSEKNQGDPLNQPDHLSPDTDNPEENPEEARIEGIKRQLIVAFTDIILSRLVSPDVLKGLENKPDKLLLNTLKFTSETYTLGQIILPTDKMFFAESFVKRLEEVWNKASELRQLGREQNTIDSLGQMGKEQKTINLCNELFRRRYTKEMIIKIVCDHFLVPIPEKSKEQQATFSQGR